LDYFISIDDKKNEGPFCGKGIKINGQVVDPSQEPKKVMAYFQKLKISRKLVMKSTIQESIEL